MAQKEKWDQKTLSPSPRINKPSVVSEEVLDNTAHIQIQLKSNLKQLLFAFFCFSEDCRFEIYHLTKYLSGMYENIDFI